MHFLSFLLHFDRDLNLDRSSLTLNHLEDGFLQIWKATISTANEQKEGEQFKCGGILPANKDTKNKSYSVVLTSGNFYPIKPHVIKTINGTYFSNVGIYLDVDKPGSPGCIVMNKLEFVEFEHYMDDLRKRGIKEIPLFVQYI